MHKYKNKIIIEGYEAKVICYDEHKEAYEVLIDAEDVGKLIDYKWRVIEEHNTFYCRSGRGERLHRVIMNAPEDMVVDHINGNGLDNRKCNLRICTHQENMMNTKKLKNTISGRTGVNWNKSRHKWEVKICYKGKSIT